MEFEQKSFDVARCLLRRHFTQQKRRDHGESDGCRKWRGRGNGPRDVGEGEERVGGDEKGWRAIFVPASDRSRGFHKAQAQLKQVQFSFVPRATDFGRKRLNGGGRVLSCLGGGERVGVCPVVATQFQSIIFYGLDGASGAGGCGGDL